MQKYSFTGKDSIKMPDLRLATHSMLVRQVHHRALGVRPGWIDGEETRERRRARCAPFRGGR